MMTSTIERVYVDIHNYCEKPYITRGNIRCALKRINKYESRLIALRYKYKKNTAEVAELLNRRHSVIVREYAFLNHKLVYLCAECDKENILRNKHKYNLLELDVDYLCAGIKVHNILHKNKINTIQQVVSIINSDGVGGLLRLRGMGIKSALRIFRGIREFGIIVNDDKPRILNVISSE